MFVQDASGEIVYAPVNETVYRIRPEWVSAALGIHTIGGERYQLLLENMRGQMPRTAKFVSVITCCFPNGDVISARGECPGTIAFVPMGNDGFGYNPVFFVPEKKKTLAQMTLEERSSISHRGKAMREFYGKLEEYLKK